MGRASEKTRRVKTKAHEFDAVSGGPEDNLPMHNAIEAEKAHQGQYRVSYEGRRDDGESEFEKKDFRVKPWRNDSEWL